MNKKQPSTLKLVRDEENREITAAFDMTEAFSHLGDKVPVVVRFVDFISDCSARGVKPSSDEWNEWLKQNGVHELVK